ncbi:ABC transporter substrate-binding protein [Rhodoferax saidenbachensis]|nr:ABC transporter substrate-binding protein [Rhodoferax saidenbachensis]
MPSIAARWVVSMSLGLLMGVEVMAASPAPVVAPPPPVAEAPKAAVTSSVLVKVADGRFLAPDIARIVNRGELVVAMRSVDSPPFFYTKNGELVGLEVDLAKAIAKELKVTVRFDRSAPSFNEVVDVIVRQEADLGISKLSRTLARAQAISFSDPYLRLNHAFILNRVKFASLARDRSLPTVIRGFTGSIGVIAKSSFADYAVKNFPTAEIREFPSWQDVLSAVEKGQVVAAYRDEFEVKSILKSDPTMSLNLRTVTFRDLEDTLGIAVGIQDTTLLAFVNQFLAEGSVKLTIDKVLKAVDH